MCSCLPVEERALFRAGCPKPRSLAPLPHSRNLMLTMSDELAEPPHKGTPGNGHQGSRGSSLQHSVPSTMTQSPPVCLQGRGLGSTGLNPTPSKSCTRRSKVQCPETIQWSYPWGTSGCHCHNDWVGRWLSLALGRGQGCGVQDSPTR